MIISLLLSATLSFGSQEFDSSAEAGAIDIARAKLIEDCLAAPPLSGKLRSAMEKDASGHRNRADSELKCRDLYRKEIAGYLRGKYAEISAKMKGKSSVAGISDEDIAKIADKHFAASFKAERAEAVGAQSKKIAGSIKPKETEFETKDDATLEKEMTAKVASQQTMPVFEENLKYISYTIVRPVIEDGRREMKRQREYLMRTRCEAYAPSAMEKEMRENLSKNIDSRRKSAPEGTICWGVFPSTVEKSIADAVERRVIDKVARNADDVALVVDAGTVMKVISKDPAGHYKAKDSEKIFRGVYTAQILGGALELSEKEAPAAEKKEFADYVRSRLASPALSRAVETRLKREVLPKWRKSRAEAAKAEAGRIWPSLIDRSWCPDAELADKIAARSDYAAAVSEWRRQPELKVLADAGVAGLMLEETSGEADRSVAAAFDLSRTAITAQNAIIGKVEPLVLSEAKDRKSSFWRNTPDLESLVKMLTSAVESEWEKTRIDTLWGDGQLPKNAKSQHVQLFPSVKKRIELVARSIFEQMEKPKPVPEQKPEPEEPPKDPVESESTSQTPPELLEYSIVVQRSADGVSVKLEQDGRVIIERSSKANIRDYREAVKAVSDKLGHDILRLR